MRMRTNFSIPFDKALPLLAGLGWAAAFLGWIAAVYFVLDGLHLLREKPVLQTKLSELRQEPSPQVDLPEQPSSEDLAGLRRSLDELNGLGAGEGLSTAALLAQLEQMTPPRVRLLSFQNDRQSGSIQLVAEALNLDDLSRFLAALEKSDRFSGVNLAKQTQGPDGSGNWIQFSVDMTENLE